MSFEEELGRIITFEERIKSQDEPEENYQVKLLMASSNNQSRGKGRGKNYKKEAKESMKWMNSPNERGISFGWYRNTNTNPVVLCWFALVLLAGSLPDLVYGSFGASSAYW
ncbi:S-locus glycoprotein domain, Bulb-type lectin domain, Zinc finger, CCHC-type [Artemisia annua]|uniref:S-locus glycoprotein domain, Bulb-type lectin domain, Zinc finger, CCHC-type n=1 Tax=Artemisia annua TaxID=35608 RepID=A0A2U1NE53_ARTAN|nr:S-locus glycoprotein domain, Bulb-type lectin domain, Zinc finger, CCHC-type [Artemisia annua]